MSDSSNGASLWVLHRFSLRKYPAAALRAQAKPLSPPDDHLECPHTFQPLYLMGILPASHASSHSLCQQKLLGGATHWKTTRSSWSTENRPHCFVINENTAGSRGGHLFLFCSQASRYSSNIWPINCSSPGLMSPQPPEDTDHVQQSLSNPLTQLEVRCSFLPALPAPVLASST